MIICQCCGDTILYGTPAVEVRAGKAYWTAHPHDRVYPEKKAFFHVGCDVAIPDNREASR